MTRTGRWRSRKIAAPHSCCWRRRSRRRDCVAPVVCDSRSPPARRCCPHNRCRRRSRSGAACTCCWCSGTPRGRRLSGRGWAPRQRQLSAAPPLLPRPLPHPPPHSRCRHHRPKPNTEHSSHGTVFWIRIKIGQNGPQPHPTKDEVKNRVFGYEYVVSGSRSYKKMSFARYGNHLTLVRAVMPAWGIQ